MFYAASLQEDEIKALPHIRYIAYRLFSRTKVGFLPKELPNTPPWLIHIWFKNNDVIFHLLIFWFKLS